MSKSDVLYVKDMNISEGEGEDAEEDIWDDRKLKDAYDKALRIANDEVAKRVAMSTNSQSKQDSSQTKKEQSSKSNISNSQKKKQKWKTGMHCRAIYEEDGLEYEACVLTMLNDQKCVVRFLGYNNSEIVPTDTLKPTLGEQARMRQIEEALGCEEQHNECRSQSSRTDSVTGCSETGGQNLLEAELSSSKRLKSSKKKKRNRSQKSLNVSDLPEMPFTMPNISTFMNAGANEMPLPPPPPMFPACYKQEDAEEQAVSSMLLSWYMSGYYTGLYQGLKRSKENGRNK